MVTRLTVLLLPIKRDRSYRQQTKGVPTAAEQFFETKRAAVGKKHVASAVSQMRITERGYEERKTAIMPPP